MEARPHDSFLTTPAAAPGAAPPRGRRSRAGLIRALIALVVVAGSLILALAVPIRLGLDLRGGTQIVLEARDGPDVRADASSTDRALEVLRRRVDALGVSEPTLTRSGERRIIVELPGVQDPRQAAEVIGKTAQLGFHPVLGLDPQAGRSATDRTAPPDRDEAGRPIALGPVALTGQAVGGAEALTDPSRGVGWSVTVDFRGPGADAWQRLTGEAACHPSGDPRRRVAIVLDDRVISSPQVDPQVGCRAGIAGGGTTITGSFGAEQAKDLAVLIRGGALPVPVQVVEQRTVGPTLGAQAIDASIGAALIGLALTALFITVVYRLVGLLAAVALGSYTLISYAALLALGATLTLPGLAGFVLAIGLAIDANVLVFERAREEYAERAAAGSTRLSRSLTAGFGRAWSAILDSNMTTLLAAGLLFLLASGPVRGFGVTLGIGVLASMVSALVVTRVLAEAVLRRGWVQRRPALSGIAGAGRLRARLAGHGGWLAGRYRALLVVSALVVALSLGGVLVRGLNLGVEFTGGRLLQYTTSAPVDVQRARQAVGAAGFPEAVVQTGRQAGGSEEITVRTRPLGNQEAGRIQAALQKVAPGLAQERDESLTASMGRELRDQAVVALLVALGAQLLYLAVRFRWTMGLAAVLSMFHDVLAVVGLFAWLGRPVDGVFLAAALTIIGISVNDSVVVFDRVREVARARPGQPFGRTAADAVLRTLPRTINTGLGAMAILAALTVLGGDSLTNVSLALLAGLVVGTWSTVATAIPLAAWLESRFPRRTAPSAAGSQAVPSRRSSTDPYAHIPHG